MGNRAAALLTTVLATGLAGCATTEMTVRKVPVPSEEAPAPVGPNGIRYSLPKPFLLVTPSPDGDGSMKVEVVYLPDECQTYAIDARTKRGQYDLSVTVKEGLLSKIVWTAKGAELAAESIKTGGELLKSEFARIEEDKKEKDAKAEEARKAAEAEVKTLDKELADKQLAMNLAALELAAAQAVIDGGDQSAEAKAALRKAQLEFDKAQASRDFAQQQVTAARARAAALPATMNKAQDTPSPAGQTPTFWSPVLYAIDDNATDVGLRAIEWGKTTPAYPKCANKPAKATTTQETFRTNAVPKPPKPQETAPKILGSTHVVRIWKTNGLRHTIVLDGPVNRLDEPGRKLNSVVGTTITAITPVPYQTVLAADRQSIRIEFPGSPLAAGTYQIIVPFKFGENGDGEAAILLTVQR